MHLKSLIDTQIEARVLIHGTSIACLQAFHLKSHRLLIELRHLRLSGVDNSCHARRQHIVHGCAPCILLYVHGINRQRAFSRSITALIKVVIVGAPLAAYKLQCSESQVRGFFEAGHKHSHKAYC